MSDDELVALYRVVRESLSVLDNCNRERWSEDEREWPRQKAFVYQNHRLLARDRDYAANVRAKIDGMDVWLQEATVAAKLRDALARSGRAPGWADFDERGAT